MSFSLQNEQSDSKKMAKTDTSSSTAMITDSIQIASSVAEESSSPLSTSKQKAHVSATEATQTFEAQPPEYVVFDKAMAIWLLSKKHRSYQQRAILRARLIEDLLDLSMTPLWALRQDYRPWPQYIEMSPGLIAMYKRHAFELAQ